MRSRAASSRVRFFWVVAVVVLFGGCTHAETRIETGVEPHGDRGPIIHLEADASQTNFNVTAIQRVPIPIRGLRYNVTRIGLEGVRDWANGVQGELVAITNASAESRFRFIDKGASGVVDVGDELDVGGAGPYDIQL